MNEIYSAHWVFRVSPNNHVIINATPFDRSLLALFGPNIEAFCRLTISSRRGCRHFPGVWDAPDPGAEEETGLGVDGRDLDAIEICG